MIVFDLFEKMKEARCWAMVRVYDCLGNYVSQCSRNVYAPNYKNELPPFLWKCRVKRIVPCDEVSLIVYIDLGDAENATF